ncbi:MAG: hydantoinase/carbamoylase family amidase [Rhodobacteraceae bacterium]|nr:hydantoinase/carbamoylase family amidase [Paracoccaceae bacterium]
MIGSLETAKRLFEELALKSADAPGVTRDSYGDGEAMAHALIAREADRIGLARRTDAVGNLYVTLPGADREAPTLMLGSHLDSVPHGGNFDGAAGVIAGLALLEDLAAGPAPPCDVTLMAIRAEEMIWFPEHYIGSRAALGLLPPDTPDRLHRADTGRTLAEHMAKQGWSPEPIRRRERLLDPKRIRAFIELHIEQGPVLVEAGVPVGIVTEIRGNMRYRFATIRGETTHAGGAPRHSRRDAVLAGAELVSCLEAEWIRRECLGEDLVLTIGEFATDAQQHGITKVPGALDFTLDFRSGSYAVLEAFDVFLRESAAENGARRGVDIALGLKSHAAEAPMDHGLRAALTAAAQRAGVEATELPSGGGHDCAVFASVGVPAAMLFVRNENGSHNPNEAMDFDDFVAAWHVLRAFAADYLV